MSFQTLEYQEQLSGQVLRVWLNRPQARNSLTLQMIEDLLALLTEKIYRNLSGGLPSYRCLVLGGRGPVFSAGADLKEMKEALHLSEEENQFRAKRLFSLFQLLQACPIPLIGVVQGAVMGGGVGLVSVCDQVMAFQGTQFGLSEVRLGLIPACISPFVLAKIGMSQARRFFLTGECFSVAEAQRIGLIHQEVKSEAEEKTLLEDWISLFLKGGPQAISAAKKLLFDLSGFAEAEKRWEQDLPLRLSEIRKSEEARERISAFLEKRKERTDS